MDKILKVVPDPVRWVKKTPTNYDDVPSDERDNNSWWYLHGKLEEEIGYDKAFAVNCKTMGYSKPMIVASVTVNDDVKILRYDNPIEYAMCVDDIVPVEVEGVDKPCIGYFWTTDHKMLTYEGEKYSSWHQRGLVVLQDDYEARDYALKKYYERTDFI